MFLLYKNVGHGWLFIFRAKARKQSFLVYIRLECHDAMLLRRRTDFLAFRYLHVDLWCSIKAAKQLTLQKNNVKTRTKWWDMKKQSFGINNVKKYIHILALHTITFLLLYRLIYSPKSNASMICRYTIGSTQKYGW